MPKPRIVYITLLVAISGLVLPFSSTKADEKTYTVPYRISKTLHMLVRAKFNGKGPFNLIVDTGAPILVITTEVAKKVGLETPKKGWAIIDEMEIEGGAKVEKTQAHIEDIYQIQGMNGLGLAGRRLDGVIGYTVLAQFRMEFDLAEQEMAWTKLDYQPPPLVPVINKGDGESKTTPPELRAMGGLVKIAGALLGRGPVKPLQSRGLLGIELVEKENQLFIARVLDEGPAHRGGIRKGDRLVKIADDPTDSLKSALRAATALRADKSVPVIVERENHTIKLTIQPDSGL